MCYCCSTIISYHVNLGVKKKIWHREGHSQIRLFSAQIEYFICWNWDTYSVNRVIFWEKIYCGRVRAGGFNKNTTKFFKKSDIHPRKSFYEKAPSCHLSSGKKDYRLVIHKYIHPLCWHKSQDEYIRRHRIQIDKNIVEEPKEFPV